MTRSCAIWRLVCLMILVSLLLGPASTSSALIMGSAGNHPLDDPGWPTGAAPIVNHAARIAHWVGPPFGGGQYTAEYRGDAEAFNEVLAQFATIDVKSRRLVVVDGPGRSFWLDPDRMADPAKARRYDLHMDWELMLWVTERWERLSQMPAFLRSPDLNPRDGGPPAVLTLYVGGNIKWEEVKVPEGVEVVDNRLEAHGYSREDGVVMEGKLVDIDTGRPLAGRIELQEIKSREGGGREYPVILTVDVDESGEWAVKGAPQKWFRVVGKAEGYASRILTYLKVDGDDVKYHPLEYELAPVVSIAGQVLDSQGRGIPEVAVDVPHVTSSHDENYDLVESYKATTDADGKFRIEGLPKGTAYPRVHRDGYIHEGLVKPVELPADNATITLAGSGNLEVVVLFKGEEIPSEYMVEVEPEGGHKVGTYGGSSRIDDKNEVVMKNIPPGVYRVHGHPNPTSDTQRTEVQEVEIKTGETTRVTIEAK